MKRLYSLLAALAFSFSPALCQTSRQEFDLTKAKATEVRLEQEIKSKSDSLIALKSKIRSLENRQLLASFENADGKIATHIARHSFASLAWANSRDIKAVSQALGHTTVRMTENYLRELSGSEQDALLDTTFEGF